MRIIRYCLVLVFAFSLFATSAVAESISSDDIREADGTSGQDTNHGSGVKTGHIQDGAVTTNKIADGAVTDAKITGPISASKISSVGLDADTVDGMHAADFAAASHNHDALYQKKYGKVAVVAQSGGDYTDPVAAMDDIATWCGTPSANNPCLLKIMPGVYDLTHPVNMKEYIDIEGSGEAVTVLQTNNNYYNIYGSDNAEIRSLTVFNKKIGAIQNIGIFNVGTSPYITDVTVFVSGATNSNVGIFNYQGSNAVMKNVTVVAEGGNSNTAIASSYDCNTTLTDSIAKAQNGGTGATTAIGVVDSFSSMSNVHASAVSPDLAIGVGVVGTQPGSGALLKDVRIESDGRGLWNQNNSVAIYDSIISGTAYGLYSDMGGTYKIAMTQISGPITPASATFTCFQVYDENLLPVVCP